MYLLNENKSIKIKKPSLEMIKIHKQTYTYIWPINM